MLFSEQVRLLEDEEILVEETPNIRVGYNYGGDTDWVTKTTKNITLDKQKIVYVKIKAYTFNGDGNVRVLKDGNPILATGNIGYDETKEVDVFIVLDAGNHSFDFQMAGSWGSSGYTELQQIKIATCNFPDKAKTNFDSGWVSVGYYPEYIIDESFTIPQTRKTCVGEIKKYTVIINVYVEVENLPESKLKNPSESDESIYNWRLYLDDTEKGWTERHHDQPLGNYGPGSFGKYVFSANPNQTYNLKIKVDNDYDSNTRNVRAVVNILVCPWIIPNEDHEPVTLTFPQGSTLYVVLEPLNGNPTKAVKIGKKRIEDFGDNCNYYYVLSGADILNAYYTFERVEVEKVNLIVSGYGGCISIIGVDVR